MEKRPDRLDAGDERAIEFDRLVSLAARCRACARMHGSMAVLSERSGDLRSRVLFVAEAPGRLGAARSGVPLTGDQSGRNFERLLGFAQLRREDIFVSNAVLCNPRDDLGRNATPTLTEIRHCLGHLRRTLEIIEPAVVVSLGAVALRALSELAPHRLTLLSDVGRPAKWNGRLLIPMYHPGARAQIHRPFERQRQDFGLLGSLIRDAISG